MVRTVTKARNSLKFMKKNASLLWPKIEQEGLKEDRVAQNEFSAKDMLGLYTSAAITIGTWQLVRIRLAA